MNNKQISYWITLLFSIVIGMLIAILTKKDDEYHGPNAKKESQKIYLHKKTGKCIKFDIIPTTCPLPKKKINILAEKFNQIVKIK